MTESSRGPIFVWRWDGRDFVLAGGNAAADVWSKGRLRDMIGTLASEAEADQPGLLERLADVHASELSITAPLKQSRDLGGGDRVLPTAFVALPPEFVLVMPETGVRVRRHGQERLSGRTRRNAVRAHRGSEHG
jgi:hypothetical protein